MRVLGIDYGLSKTGLALSDLHGVTCRPFGILKERDRQRLVRSIVAAAREQEVEVLVVGLPRPLSGGTNSQMEAAMAFAEQLRQEAGMPVHTWDERFTTRLAERGRSSDEPADAVAACYMLQSYLDAHALDSVRNV